MIASIMALPAVVPGGSVGNILITTDVGIGEYSMLAVGALFPMLLFKQLLLASDRWNDNLKCSLDMAIFPLLFSFCAITLFKIKEFI